MENSKYVYPEVPDKNFFGLFIFVVESEKESWIEELQPAIGIEWKCWAHGNKNFTVPNNMVKEIMDAADLGRTIFVSSEIPIKTQRVSYSFGGGSGTVLLSLNNKKLFFSYNQNDREGLHDLYGGKQYYSSRSGSSGAGFLCPTAEQNDLLEIPGTYRANITYLSEAWPCEIMGTKLMVPVEGITENCPAVVEKNGELFFFSYAWEVIDALLGKFPEARNKVVYKYLDNEFQLKEFEVLWGGNHMGIQNGKPYHLPYPFEAYVSLLKHMPCTLEIEELGSFILNKMNLGITENKKLVQKGYFGFPKEVIEGELFPKDNFRSWSHGWVTKGFGPFKFVYKRVSGGSKVYAVLEAVPSEINEKYSVLENTSMEYELLVENVVEWFSKPVEEWVEQMKNELIKKIRSQFLNSARWDQNQQIEKVKQYLSENLDTVLTIEDSLATGNCIPGTESFMNEYSLRKGEMICKDILAHKRLEEMLKNDRFRVVIINKFFKEEDIESENLPGQRTRPRMRNIHTETQEE